MNKLDFEQLKNYAFSRLENELPASLYYHNLQHTRDEMLPAIERIAVPEGLHGESLLLLKTAGLFHDMGFIYSYRDHEEASINIVKRVLPDYGYRWEQINAICRMIMATHLPHAPHSLAEQIIADADMIVLGEDNFLERNCLLRLEAEIYQRPFSEKEWYQEQLDFIEGHEYFTNTARQIQNPGKLRNVEEIKQIIVNLNGSSG